MIHDLHITVAQNAKGATKLLYLGLDAQAANEAFEAADKSNVSVSLISHPYPTRLRYPAAEAATIKSQQEDTKRRQNADAQRTELEADKKRAEAQKLLDEAEALSPSKTPEPDPKKESEKEEKTES